MSVFTYVRFILPPCSLCLSIHHTEQCIAYRTHRVSQTYKLQTHQAYNAVLKVRVNSFSISLLLPHVPCYYRRPLVCHYFYSTSFIIRVEFTAVAANPNSCAIVRCPPSNFCITLSLTSKCIVTSFLAGPFFPLHHQYEY